MYEQLDVFSFIKDDKEQENGKAKRLKVGDKIGRLVLGEVVVATITEVCGNEEYFFYRTDRGTCFEKTDRTDFEQMEKEAEEIRKQHDIIEIDRFDKFFAVEYPHRECNGHIMCAMVGIYNGMLFWKHDVTYQFLEKVKNIEKEYDKIAYEITHYFNKKREYKILDNPISIERLYYSKSRNLYASAGYVKQNP